MYVGFPLLHVFTTVWPLTDMCFSVQIVVIESRGMLGFSWMQHLTYTFSFWWNLSSASIDRDFFNFLPRNSLFSMFADLTNVFLSSLFLKWMKACGHSILAFSIVVPIFVKDSFKNCMTSTSDVSLWNPVMTALPWFLSTCAPLFSSILLSNFVYFKDFLSPWIFHWFVCICHLFLSFSRWLLSSSRVNALRLIWDFLVETFQSFRRFSSVLLIAWINSFLNNNASSLGLVSVAFAYFSQLLCPSSADSRASTASLISIPPSSLRDVSIVVSFPKFSSFFLFCSANFPWCARYVVLRGIADLFSTSSNIDIAFSCLSHLMLIVFPLHVHTLIVIMFFSFSPSGSTMIFPANSLEYVKM